MEYVAILRKIVLFRRYLPNQTKLNHTKPRLFAIVAYAVTLRKIVLIRRYLPNQTELNHKNSYQPIMTRKGKGVMSAESNETNTKCINEIAHLTRLPEIETLMTSNFLKNQWKCR
jgi:hypothetical protein